MKFSLNSTILIILKCNNNVIYSVIFKVVCYSQVEMDQIIAHTTTTSVSEKVLENRKRLNSSQLSAKHKAKITGNIDFFEENDIIFCCKVLDHT